MTFWNGLCENEVIIYWFNFRLSLLLSIRLTINQHRFQWSEKLGTNMRQIITEIIDDTVRWRIVHHQASMRYDYLRKKMFTLCLDSNVDATEKIFVYAFVDRERLFKTCRFLPPSVLICEDEITGKHFPNYWPFVRVIQWSSVDSLRYIKPMGQ